MNFETYLLPSRILRNSKQKLHDQLFKIIQELIVNNKINPGDKLPSIRKLSAQLGISINTVIHTYQQLILEGYIETTTGKAATVATELPIITNSRRVTKNNEFRKLKIHMNDSLGRSKNIKVNSKIDFRIGEIKMEVDFIATLNKITNNHIPVTGEDLKNYADPCGNLSLRREIAKLVHYKNNIICDERQILITSGSQESLTLITHLTKSDHTNFISEKPGYIGLENLFKLLNINSIHCDSSDVESYISTINTAGSATIFTTPAKQFPLGHSISEVDKVRIAESVSASGSLIIENYYDTDPLYQYTTPASFISLIPNNTIHINSFTSTLGPAYRIGYIIANKDIITKIASIKSLITASNSIINQNILANLLTTNAYDKHYKILRRELLTKRNKLINILENCGGTLTGYNSGTYLNWDLSSSTIDTDLLLSKLLDENIIIYTVEMISNCKINSNFKKILVIGYGGVSLNEIDNLGSALMKHLKSCMK
ncbi:PLP-dependent aminotransferase family protein [Aquitalea sp. LB_tupeE]|uniref:aminotransferase-like domain-containing protein n=1 Tax=Aquitalea sp. LB_tupeE TaxID=2748078 RepID=UPI0015B999EA|nr:PLP-dependent aminotransferase family protein [Aquitalea sp. LB_tupeE]NWK78824.1 PLP-dependent aminotransferase family protein [Aquitalea sp. LB_tupeE]